MGIFPEKKLGFGLMRLPLNDVQDPSDVDIEQVKDMVDEFLVAGFTYFDTAWMYNGFASERVAKEALVDRHPRESFTLATKLHNGFIETPADCDRIFDEQLGKTGAGYFDYYLLHGVDEGSLKTFEDLDCFGWLASKRDEGLVRHAGFSFHGTSGCPLGIAIPQYFSLYNEDMREDLEKKGWTANFVNYANLAEGFGKAGDCIACGQCERACPQHLPIIELLKDVAIHYEHGSL